MTQQARVYRMVMEKHVCPFGLKAKDLLKRKGFIVDDHHLTSRDQTDAFKQEYDVKTTPQVFIGDERIGGYDALRQYLGLSKKDNEAVTYKPIIAIFIVTFLMALALSIQQQAPLFSGQTLFVFIAISMCVLAIQKLRDLDSFTNQFLGYDLLAQRVVPYAYVYPFAEAFAGIGMLAQVAHHLVGIVSFLIGSLGAVSVIYAVYIQKRELKCACVGGNSNVPLGFVSLTENVMMIIMGVWMLSR